MFALSHFLTDKPVISVAIPHDIVMFVILDHHWGWTRFISISFIANNLHFICILILWFVLSEHLSEVSKLPRVIPCCVICEMYKNKFGNRTYVHTLRLFGGKLLIVRYMNTLTSISDAPVPGVSIYNLTGKKNSICHSYTPFFLFMIYFISYLP